MKKKFLIVVAFILTIFLLFSGCTSEQNKTNQDQTDDDGDTNGGTNEDNDTEVTDDTNRFIGVWLEEVDYDGGTRTMRHTYSNDGTYTFEILDIDHSDTGTWALEDDQLITTTNSIHLYSYSFSDDDTTLTLTDATTEELTILSKQ